MKLLGDMNDRNCISENISSSNEDNNDTTNTSVNIEYDSATVAEQVVERVNSCKDVYLFK